MGFALKHLAEVQVLGNLHKGLSDTPLEMALVSRWPAAVEATPCAGDLSRSCINSCGEVPGRCRCRWYQVQVSERFGCNLGGSIKHCNQQLKGLKGALLAPAYSFGSVVKCCTGLKGSI